MHDAAIKHAAIELMEFGALDREIATVLDVPRRTIHEWRRARGDGVLGALCPRCSGRCRPTMFADGDYAELLGLYLGDGHILRVGRSFRLRLSLDARFGEVVREAKELMARCFPANVVGEAIRDGGSCRIVSIDHRHLPCLFPQHGPGKKHLRPIVLESWQQSQVARAPAAFARGLIRSDGCVFINRTGRYEYLSYDFANRSQDILDLFEGALDALGIERRRYRHHVRVYRRASVERMVALVGLKA